MDSGFNIQIGRIRDSDLGLQGPIDRIVLIGEQPASVGSVVPERGNEK